MYDILVTIWAGLPLVAILIGGGSLVFVLILLYDMAINKLLKNGYGGAATFLLATPLFCLFVPYLMF